MIYGILFEKIQDTDFSPGYYYAHIPSLGLTTHGSGIEGAREAAKDLIKLWLAEKKTGEKIKPPYYFEKVTPNKNDLKKQRLELSDRVRNGELHLTSTS